MMIRSTPGGHEVTLATAFAMIVVLWAAWFSRLTGGAGVAYGSGDSRNVSVRAVAAGQEAAHRAVPGGKRSVGPQVRGETNDSASVAAESHDCGRTGRSPGAGTTEEAFTSRKAGASGWSFDKVIEAIQPVFRYSGRVEHGLMSFFDGIERNPPTLLNLDDDWDVSDNPVEIRNRMLNRDWMFKTFLGRYGSCYYHTFLSTGAGPYGADLLIHQFWYYFPTGEARYFGTDDQGFAMVEMEQTVAKTDGEMARFREIVRKDLEDDRSRLVRMLPAAGDGLSRKRIGSMIARIEQILSRTVEVPVNYFIEHIYTVSTMHIGGDLKPRILRYDRASVRWQGTRPVVYVAEGTHELVARRSDFSNGNHCDEPFIVHPSGRERLVNLHNPHDPDNPFPGGVNVHGLRLGGCFTGHPLYWLGCRRYLAGKRLEGNDSAGSPKRLEGRKR